MPTIADSNQLGGLARQNVLGNCWFTLVTVTVGKGFKVKKTLKERQGSFLHVALDAGLELFRSKRLRPIMADTAELPLVELCHGHFRRSGKFLHPKGLDMALLALELLLGHMQIVTKRHRG